VFCPRIRTRQPNRTSGYIHIYYKYILFFIKTKNSGKIRGNCSVEISTNDDLITKPPQRLILFRRTWWIINYPEIYHWQREKGSFERSKLAKVLDSSFIFTGWSRILWSKSKNQAHMSEQARNECLSEAGRHENKEHLAYMRVVLEKLKRKRAKQDHISLVYFT